MALGLERRTGRRDDTLVRRRRRQSNASAAHARYEASVVIFAARLREAVREVESALVTLDSTASRSMSVRAGRRRIRQRIRRRE